MTFYFIEMHLYIHAQLLCKQKPLFLDAINRLTALVCIYAKKISHTITPPPPA